MANLTVPPLSSTVPLLKGLGERLRLARLRRRLQSKQVAERAGMSVITLRKIERGDAGVTLGAYVSVLQVLQLQTDLKKIAAEDALGRSLQDIEGGGGLRVRRAPKNARRIAPVQADQARAAQHMLATELKNCVVSESAAKLNSAISANELMGLLDLGSATDAASKE